MNDFFTKDFAAVYVALIWVIFWSVILIAFWRHVSLIAEAIVKRIQRGSSVTVGPVSIGEPPKELRESSAGTVAVSDPAPVTPPEVESASNINAEYRKLTDGYFLLHASEVLRERTAPKSGRYRVRVWLESYSDKDLENVTRVTYHVWNDFSRPVISTTSRDSRFDLWMSIYGEFPVLAFVELRDGPGILLTRYIDLPGRPPD